MTEETEATQITAEETPRIWFSMMPNIVDELGLSAHAYRLYGHYRRVIGETAGECWESTRTTAKACNIGIGTVSKAKGELVEKGLIRIDKSKRGTDTVTLINIWPQNNDAYLKLKAARSSGEHQTAARSSDEQTCSPDEQACSPGETKKNPSNKNPVEDSTEGAQPPLIELKEGKDEKPQSETPTNFEAWKTSLRESPNRPAVLRWMFTVLFPDQDPPAFGRFAVVAREAGGWSVLALKMWELSPRPPVGNPLDYIQAAARNEKARNPSRRTKKKKGAKPAGEQADLFNQRKSEYADAVPAGTMGFQDN